MDENNYYTVHCSNRTSSFTSVFHTLEEVTKYLEIRETANSLGGTDILIQQKYGWDEQERRELERLKKKYEPIGEK